MSALRLFADPTPRPVEGIDLRLAPCEDVIASLPPESVDLVVADPPWEYDQRVGGNGPHVSEHYDCLPTDVIVGHLAAARGVVRPGGRCVLWTTHSQLPGLSRFVRHDDAGAWLAGWRWVTGGTWAKVCPDDAAGGRGAPGIGYHALSSESEVWILLLGPGPHARAPVPGCWVQPRHRGRGEEHSEKPIPYQRQMVRHYASEGLVLDIYAGLGSVARACALEGRRYVGAEIDPERHAKALGLLAHALQGAA